MELGVGFRIRGQQRELQSMIFDLAPKLFDTIDALLVYYWFRDCSLDPPDAHDFAILDPKSGERARILRAPPR
jgi:hypothetical protein